MRIGGGRRRLAIWATALFIGQAFSTTIHVPGDWAQIQAAVDAAAAGDTVLVQPGTYEEHEIGFRGKSIVVRGTDPGDSTVVQATVVNGSELGRVFVFDSAEDTLAVLEGVTVTGAIGCAVSCNRASATIRMCRIVGNDGTGICASWSAPVIEDCVISRNHAGWGWYNGGGIDLFASAARVKGCRISDNITEEGDGGGLRVASAGHDVEIAVSECNISGNTAQRGDGGGVSVSSVGASFLVDCVVKGNRAEDDYFGRQGSGGGIYLSSGGLTIRNCEIVENEATFFGGGLWLGGDSTFVEECQIRSNVASMGGGVETRGSAVFRRVDIFDNRAQGVDAQGGGVRVKGYSPGYSDSIRFEQCRVVDNDVAGRWASGGGLYADNWHSLMLDGCIVAGNAATGDDTAAGGALFGYRLDVATITNCTIVDNSVVADSLAAWGGLLIKDTPLFVANSIARANTLGDLGGSAGQSNVRYSNIGGGWPGPGNIDIEPRLAPFHGFAYLLAPDSPCIDAGDPLILDGISDWHPRWPNWAPNDERSDMGAYGGESNGAWLAGTVVRLRALSAFPRDRVQSR